MIDRPIPVVTLAFRNHVADGDYVASLALGDGAESQVIEVARVSMAMIDGNETLARFITFAKDVAAAFLVEVFGAAVIIGEAQPIEENEGIQCPIKTKSAN